MGNQHIKCPFPGWQEYDMYMENLLTTQVPLKCSASWFVNFPISQFLPTNIMLYSLPSFSGCDWPQFLQPTYIIKPNITIITLESARSKFCHFWWNRLLVPPNCLCQPTKLYTAKGQKTTFWTSIFLHNSPNFKSSGHSGTTHLKP